MWSMLYCAFYFFTDSRHARRKAGWSQMYPADKGKSLQLVWFLPSPSGMQ
jgi:hypothetical protein